MTIPVTQASFARVKLVELVDLVSSYPEDKPYEERYDIDRLPHTAWGVEDIVSALEDAADAVEEAGGELSITEVGRTWAVSKKARDKYLAGEKHAYVAPPGGSMHNSGSAVDFWVYQLNFEGLSQSEWLGKLWDLIIPLGFTPIIESPSLQKSECWHFDFRGPWHSTYKWFKENHRSEAYTMMARCAQADAAVWGGANPEEMAVQAHLHRLGFHEAGLVDGDLGDKSIHALNRFGEVYAVNNVVEMAKDDPAGLVVAEMNSRKAKKFEMRG